MPSITFILVRPHNPGNIGAAARAIANFRFTRLAVVAPTHLPTHPEARRFAVSAAPLLDRIQVAPSIMVAAGECQYLIGTSRRRGKHRQPFCPIGGIGALLQPLSSTTRVGILFGPEEKGLTNDELAMCHAVVTIPSDADYPSLNLSHAVAIVAYEISRHRQSVSVTTARRLPTPLAATDVVEGMYGRLETVLTTIGFFKYRSGPRIMRELRHLLGRARLTHREAQILWAIWQRILWRLTA